jgi:hypothetical protein
MVARGGRQAPDGTSGTQATLLTVTERSKPEAPTAWQGRILAVYPDGSQSDFDTSDYIARAGEPLADTGTHDNKGLPSRLQAAYARRLSAHSRQHRRERRSMV